MEHTTEIKKQIIKGLEQILKPEAFVWIEALSQFRKITDFGFINMPISFSDYPDALIVEGHFGLRVDVIENMAYPFTNGIKGFQPESHTLIASIGRLKGKRFERYTLTSPSETKVVLASLEAAYRELAIPFWKEYQELSALYQLFNYNREDQLGLVSNWNYACLRGIVVAKILNRPDLPQLLQKHRDALDLLYAHDLLKERFEQLAIYLQELSMN